MTVRVVLLLATVLATPAAAGQQAGSGAAAVDEGRALFLTYCSSCHGTTGRGDGPVSETLRGRPADLTELANATEGAFIAQRILRIVDGRDRHIKAHGSFEMPVWGDAFKRREGLGEEAIKARIEAIVRYIQSIQHRKG